MKQKVKRKTVACRKPVKRVSVRCKTMREFEKKLEEMAAGKFKGKIEYEIK